MSPHAPLRRASTMCQRTFMVGVVAGLFAILTPVSAWAAASPSPSPTTTAQLSHTVTNFGLLFFGAAGIAVILFVIVFLRLRRA